MQLLLFSLTVYAQTAMLYRVNLSAVDSESAYQLIQTKFMFQKVMFIALKQTQLSSVHQHPTYAINKSCDEANNPRQTHNKCEAGIQTEVCAGFGRIAQLGPRGVDDTRTPNEEDGVEGHYDEQGPNSKDKNCPSITDVTLLFTVARA